MMVQKARLKRVDERITAESGIRKGLSEKHVTLHDCGLVGYGIFRRRLVET
jgi:hypothetical protein